MKTILSLFDYSGEWPRPYLESGYDVIQVDIKHGDNVYLLDVDDLPEIHGVLAAPPCTDFAVSGAQYWPGKDTDGRTFQSLALVYHALSLIWQLRQRDQIAWWCLENPVGRLNKLVPELQLYGPRYFDPCDYGDPYTKKTGLWGEFMLPNFPDMAVEPERVCSQGSWLQTLPGQSEQTKELRSITPAGFSKAFFLANP